MTYIPRTIESRIRTASATMPVIGIVGPRQSGKTTLARHLFPDYLYVNLEFPDDRLFAESDPRGFLAQSDHMIIDEIQRVPELFSYVQGFVDEFPGRAYVLTGSNNFALIEKISQSLAGCIALFTVLPFSLAEIPADRAHSADLLLVQLTGCYPRVVAEGNNPAEWYQGYIQTYLERDIRQITSIHMMDRFLKFIQILATRATNILNYTALSKEVGVAVNTIRDWFSVLAASYIVYTVEPYHGNIKKRLTSIPKCYFVDTGLLCSLLGIRSVESLANHALSGYIFENFVMGEFFKGSHTINDGSKLYFYREHAGTEVDIVRTTSGSIDLFEVKKSKIVKSEFFDSLDLFAQEVANNNPVKHLVYGGDKSYRDKDHYVVSWKDISKQLDA